MRRLLVADSRLGDIGEETRFGVACLVDVALEGGVEEVAVEEGGGGDAFIAIVGLGETVVGGTTDVMQDKGKAGEASTEGEVRELDKLRVGDADESLVVLMEKVGEVVSGSCWLLDMDTGEGVSNWVVSCTFGWGAFAIALCG